MAKTRKTARQKLEGMQEPQIVVDPKGRGKMLIPRPLDIDALIRGVEKGKLVTIGQVRERLARDQGADITCPLTTGIFLRIVAEVAEEDFRSSKETITPYWRVLRDDGSLNEKLPGGVAAQAGRLTTEGHAIEPERGKKPPKVKDFETHLAKL